MKQILSALGITILLTACSQAVLVEPTATANAPTATTASTETVAANQVERLLTAYLAEEEIDVSGLSPDEFTKFSAELAKRRNAERGINPILYNNEACISPDNYMLMNYDGHPDMNETIEMYLPIAGKDNEGNLRIVNHEGEISTIENSADVDWNMRITDPNDPRINWPTTKVLDSGFVEAQYRVYHPDNPTELIPAILLDSSPGQIFLTGDQPAIVPSIRFLIIETDDANNPILAREIISIGGPKFNLFEEGSSLDKESEIVEIPTDFFDNLQVDCVYFIGGPINQIKFYKATMRANTDDYLGIINSNSTYSVLMGNKKNMKDMLLLATSILIKH